MMAVKLLSVGVCHSVFVYIYMYVYNVSQNPLLNTDNTTYLVKTYLFY